jgi:hypothetical protein
MATSNSTVGGGGTSAGGLIGKGATRDRGRMSNEEMDTSTNMARELEHQGEGKVPTRIANQEPRTPPSRNAKKSGRRAQGKKA